jgi:hypothetical protein
MNDHALMLEDFPIDAARQRALRTAIEQRREAQVLASPEGRT